MKIYHPIIAFSVLTANAVADEKVQDMKLIGYQWATDCKLPSTKICFPDEKGSHCVIKLNPECESEE